MAGLAAFAMVLVALLLLLRRHKRNAIIHHRNELGYGGPASGASEGISSQQEPSSNPFSAVFGLFAAGRNRHQRNPSAASDERGFYRVSGRKLEPVLGGPRPRGSSVSAPPYSEDGGSLAKEIGTSISTISGAGPSRLSSPTPTPMGPVGLQPPVRDVIPEDQEYDATYKETGGGVRELSTPTPTPSMLMPVSSPSPLGGRPAIGGGAGRDGLGRSLPSLDGSRASKFTEDIL